MVVALLDSSVLWPSLQRDFLLSLAAERMYRPVWSAEILAELEHEQARKLVARHGLDDTEAAQRAARLVATMRQAFDDAEVTGWEPLAGAYALPDPADEHVLMAAVAAGAGAIVTSNVIFARKVRWLAGCCSRRWRSCMMLTAPANLACTVRRCASFGLALRSRTRSMPVLHPSEGGDQVLRQSAGSEAQDVLKQMRQLVCE